MPAAEIVAAENDSIESIGDAWRAGWDVFIGALFAIGFVLAVAAPFIMTAVLVLGVAWLATRRRRHTTRSDRHTSGATASDAEAVADPVSEAITPDEQLAGPSPRG